MDDAKSFDVGCGVVDSCVVEVKWLCHNGRVKRHVRLRADKETVLAAAINCDVALR